MGSFVQEDKNISKVSNIADNIYLYKIYQLNILWKNLSNFLNDNIHEKNI